MNLPMLPHDKANHFIYGAFIYLIASIWFEPYPAMFIVMSIAFFKESYDIYTHSDFSFADFFITAIGGFTILIAQIIN